LQIHTSNPWQNPSQEPSQASSQIPIVEICLMNPGRSLHKNHLLPTRYKYLLNSRHKKQTQIPTSDPSQEASQEPSYCRSRQKSQREFLLLIHLRKSHRSNHKSPHRLQRPIHLMNPRKSRLIGPLQKPAHFFTSHPSQEQPRQTSQTTSQILTPNTSQEPSHSRFKSHLSFLHPTRRSKLCRICRKNRHSCLILIYLRNHRENHRRLLHPIHPKPSQNP